jgi:glucokinase
MMMPGALAHPCLLADIGGTNARFAVAMGPGDALTPVLRFATGASGDIGETVEGAIAASACRPRSFVAAVAGPLDGRSAELTNARTPTGRLRIDGPALAARFGLDQGLLLNDFEALSLATPFLGPERTMPIGKAATPAGGPVVVVGPGTGLGVGGLLNADGCLYPVASEGGHAGIGPETEAEAALWPHLGEGRISAEDVISGRGLLRLHWARMRAIGRQPAHADAAAVTQAALGEDDAEARHVAHVFLGLLGRFAGDMALAFGATGGVFIGGGIAPRFRDLLAESALREAFERKGPLSGYMRDIPMRLILSDDAALIGLAAVAAEPSRFALDYRNRLWRA